MKKKVIIILIILFILFLAIFMVDFCKFSNSEPPIFAKEGDAISIEQVHNSAYHGLGYSIYFSELQIVPGEFGIAHKKITFLGKTLSELKYRKIEGKILQIDDNKITLSRIQKMSTDKQGVFVVELNKDTRITTKLMYPMEFSNLKVGNEVAITYDEKDFNTKKETITNPYLIQTLTTTYKIPNEKIKAGQYYLDFGKYEYTDNEKTESLILNNDGTFSYSNGTETVTGEYDIIAYKQDLFEKDIVVIISCSSDNGNFDLNAGYTVKDDNKFGNFEYVGK